MALYTTVTVPKDFYQSTSPIHSSCVPPIKFNPTLRSITQEHRTLSALLSLSRSRTPN